MGASMLRIWRGVLIGTVFIPFCTFWAQDQDVDRIFSLMVPPLAVTMLVAVISAICARIRRSLALSPADILVVYTMLAVATAMSGEWLDMIAGQMYGYAIYARNNPRWVDRILPHLPELFFFKDGNVLKDFSEGSKPSYVFWQELPLWLPKVGIWTAFLTLLTGSMVSINALMREQWVAQEKLAFPIVQIPMALADTGGPGSIWRSKLLWAGFACTFLIDMLNGFAFLYPQLPSINIRLLGNLSSWFSSPPWNVTGWTPIGIYPFVSALGAFVPTELLRSLIVFFFFRKAQQIVAYTQGNEQGTFGGGGLTPSPPYFSEQSWGAFLALFLSAMWFARPHLSTVWIAIRTGVDPASHEAGVRYRSAFGWLVTCILGLCALVTLAGIPFWWTLLYLIVYLMFSVAMTRLRAQIGAPTHEMAYMGPHQLLIDSQGTMAINADLATKTLTTFHLMNRIHRTHPMPTFLESQYAAPKFGINARQISIILMTATVLGTFFGFMCHIYLGYKIIPIAWVSNEAGAFISDLQSTPRKPNAAAMLAVGAGGLFVWILDWLRFRYVGFWLHPGAYALAMNFGIDYYWFGLLIVLLAKEFLERFYGLRGAKWLRLVAIGLILGEFTAELIWASYSMANNRQLTYSISINSKLSWDK